MCRKPPPLPIRAKRLLEALVEFLLDAVLFFEVVDIGLIVVDRGHVVAEQVEREVGEKTALDKGKYVTDKRLNIEWMFHVLPSFLLHEQIAKRHEAEYAKYRRRHTNVKHEL